MSTCRFRYPSIYIVFGEFLVTLLEMLFLIAYCDEYTFYCPTKDYLHALENPTWYCNIATGEHHYKKKTVVVKFVYCRVVVVTCTHSKEQCSCWDFTLTGARRHTVSGTLNFACCIASSHTHMQHWGQHSYRYVTLVH